jgi:electron transport complex protein RnfB
MDPHHIDAIDALLPQTQCTRCGYPDCRAYATAIAVGEAGYDQCPPGGQAGVRRLADYLGKPEIPLNAEYGTESPAATAVIDERHCIGCTLCIQACPVDAIIGSAKSMHTVLTAYCTGCDLCVAPCPVDCIDMIALSELAARGQAAAAQLIELSSADSAAIARRRYLAHKSRLDWERADAARRLNEKYETESPQQAAPTDRALSSKSSQASGSERGDRKKQTIAAALLRARARRTEFERARRKTR